MTSPNEPILKVAIAAPLHRLFDYLPPKNVNVVNDQRGARVLVPFGHQQKIGVLIKVTNETNIALHKLKRAQQILDEEHCITPELLTLCEWAANYYRHPLGEVISAALPKKIRQGAVLLPVTTYWCVSKQVPNDAQNQLQRAPRQSELLARIAQHDQGLSMAQLKALAFDYRGPLKALQQKGWVETQQQSEKILLDSDTPTQTNHIQTPPIQLNPEQRHVLERLLPQTRFECFLLHGVTGSGKTEVYFRYIQQMLDHRRQILVLVPEISLTPQLLQRFQRRFKAPIAIMHSGLSDTERLLYWRTTYTGEAKIVIGTRSAVFAPLHNLGLIVIDEEHDPSLKQQEGFRYSARDLAIVRAQQLDIPIVLGSATPSLEAIKNVVDSRYSLLELSQRAGVAIEPDIELVDLRVEPSHQGISTYAMSKTQQHLNSNGQVLFFLNRRGYAPSWYCTGCGWVAHCHDCDARLTYHQRPHQLRCHHCGLRDRTIENCPQCESSLKAVGQGTERIEEYLRQQFPQYAIDRMDRDVVRSPQQLERFIRRVKEGHTRILIGTQMLAKGHHFPQVTLVVVVNADQGLFGIDFRSTERLAQTIVQVAGRAGRADKPGEVIIQTSYPEHTLLQHLIHEGYNGFAQAALQERQQTRWPPYTHLALLRAYSNQQSRTQNFLSAAKHHVGSLAQRHQVSLWGPVTAPMARRAGKQHGQLLCQSGNRTALGHVLQKLSYFLSEQSPDANVRWSMDVDPIELF